MRRSNSMPVMYITIPAVQAAAITDGIRRHDSPSMQKSLEKEDIELNTQSYIASGINEDCKLDMDMGTREGNNIGGKWFVCDIMHVAHEMLNTMLTISHHFLSRK